MPVFQYRGVSHTGTMSSGVIEASDENGALQALRAQRLRVLSLTRSNGALKSSRRLDNVEPHSAAQLDSDAVQAALEKLGQRDKPAKGGKAPSEVDVMRLSAELGVLLTAGLPLDKAMRVQVKGGFVNRVQNPAFCVSFGSHSTSQSVCRFVSVRRDLYRFG